MADQQQSTSSHRSTSSISPIGLPSTSAVPSPSPTTTADTSSLRSTHAFSGTNAANPLGNHRYETEIRRSYLKEFHTLTQKAIELKNCITSLREKVSPSDEELIQLESLEEEFKRVKDKSYLLSSQL
ncbi:hypothetical protein HDU76_007983, partial [Blyttiomyces sp. JEL0837]